MTNRGMANAEHFPCVYKLCKRGPLIEATYSLER
jgi:hypothetical protein